MVIFFTHRYMLFSITNCKAQWPGGLSIEPIPTKTNLFTLQNQHNRV
jgi:hypothetical protein